MKEGVEVKGSGSDTMSNSGQLVLSIARHTEGIERSLNIDGGRRASSASSSQQHYVNALRGHYVGEANAADVAASLLFAARIMRY